ncbi:MAG: hypothetical protein KGZ41_00385 [Dethiobacter sp.]|jgi:hypothetical protein|nr:hypothetical protein [Dethiobacter sp.]MBS3897922.1 hypothetical protein [Dethiobacter sp.]MBS3982235.1 hypothetical protein [Dethiobacter sp.]MCL4462977.1 hypothetical protein [Bacillota bacterium]MCL5993212.1 hypothetical protein [Bacillota bacterium]
MSQEGGFPDLLANHLDDAVRLAKELGLSTRVVITAPPREASPGPLRVVRQRLADDGQTLELTVAAEVWA